MILGCVAGISRLHLIKAHSVMGSVADYRREQPDVELGLLPKTTPDADIDELIGLAMRSERDGIAVVENGAVIGVITTRGLLRGVKGVQSSERAAA